MAEDRYTANSGARPETSVREQIDSAQSVSGPMVPIPKGRGSAQFGALQSVNPAPILEQLRAGKSLRAIANDLGVHNTSLRAWLLIEDRAEYQEAVKLSLATRIVEADERLEEAEDMTSIARAREICKFSRWDAERRLSGTFGQRTQVEVQHRSIRDVSEAQLVHTIEQLSNVAALPVDNQAQLEDQDQQPTDT